MSPVTGLHHVTAISGDPHRNAAFYAAALGQRLIKKTVNFDDPSTYHLYYGDRTSSAGTVMTFFPWSSAPKGALGAGQASVTQYAVPFGSLPFWRKRLPALGASIVASEEVVFAETRAVFADPDGLLLALVETEDPRAPWTTEEIGEDVAVRGFHGVTLALQDGESTASILTGALGYAPDGTQAQGRGELRRFRRAGGVAGVVDLHVDPALAPGREGVGTVHHVAFSVPDAAAQDAVRSALLNLGLQVTPRIDRQYFNAIYTRTPAGVLFEVATEEPGFARDEDVERLGERLMLPDQYEPHRARIEATLPPLGL
ncbi:MAG: ring-cleaving dioxygenase [Pseudomonadota bacterium]